MKYFFINIGKYKEDTNRVHMMCAHVLNKYYATDVIRYSNKRSSAHF